MRPFARASKRWKSAAKSGSWSRSSCSNSASHEAIGAYTGAPRWSRSRVMESSIRRPRIHWWGKQSS
eukprot:scaffold289912_cov28-Tisochrysis_lutea.AAC.2